MLGIRSYLFLAVGGVVGVILRYQVGLWVSQWNTSLFPWATLIINVTGSFALGFIMRYTLNSSISMETRLLLTTGLCGGYTTLSTFSFEFVQLMMEKQHGIAFAYLSSTAIISPLACFSGWMLSRALR